MLKVLVLTLILLTALTVSPYMIPQGISSSETSSLSPEGSGDGNENGGSGSEDKSPQDDSGDSSRPDDNEGDDNGIGQTDERELTGDDDDNGVDKEPPSSTERGGNPLEGLNLPSGWGKAECEKYLKSLGGSDETGVGDVIVGPFETREDYCKRILGGAGIDVSNNDNNNNDDLTGQSIVSCSETPGIVITEEGMPSKSGQKPQPQPSSPPPQQPAPAGGC